MPDTHATRPTHAGTGTGQIGEVMSKEDISKKIVELARKREEFLKAANLELGRIEGQIQLLQEQYKEDGSAEPAPDAGTGTGSDSDPAQEGSPV
jgi:predicted neutral ceramidase superfamily lipid hydrolase